MGLKERVVQACFPACSTPLALPLPHHVHEEIPGSQGTFLRSAVLPQDDHSEPDGSVTSSPVGCWPAFGLKAWCIM